MSEVKARANALLQETLGPSAERIRSTLRDFGFSGYAADAFCALVRISDASAGDLVVKTGIPDSKIYYALDELAEKGLVEVQEGKPKTYRVVPAKEVEIRLNRLVEAEYDRRRAATTRLGSLLEPLRAATKSPGTDVAYIVKGLPNIVARAKALVSSARKEVVVLASDEEIFRKLEDDLARSARRRVRIRLAVPEIPVMKDLESRRNPSDRLWVRPSGRRWPTGLDDVPDGGRRRLCDYVDRSDAGPARSRLLGESALLRHVILASHANRSLHRKCESRQTGNYREEEEKGHG